MPPTNKPIRYRQIHLDFHTSEHIPGIGPVTATVRLPKTPKCAYEAVTGKALAISEQGEGTYSVTLDRLHIHAAVVFEQG